VAQSTARWQAVDHGAQQGQIDGLNGGQDHRRAHGPARRIDPILRQTLQKAASLTPQIKRPATFQSRPDCDKPKIAARFGQGQVGQGEKAVQDRDQGCLAHGVAGRGLGRDIPFQQAHPGVGHLGAGILPDQAKRSRDRLVKVTCQQGSQ
jgi:hypothetical protein